MKRKSMARLAIAAAGVACLALTAWVGVVTAKPELGEQDETISVMRRKLIASQKILEALALESYDSIQEHSSTLLMLSHESQWNKWRSERFNQHASEFRWSIDKMNEAAEDQNIDGVTMAYMQVVMSCVECHKTVRGMEDTAWVR